MYCRRPSCMLSWVKVPCCLLNQFLSTQSSRGNPNWESHFGFSSMNMHVLNMSERATASHWWTCQFSQLFYQEKLEGKENETEPDRKNGWLDMFERAGLQLWLCWSTDGHHQSAKLSKPPLLTLCLPEFLDFWPCLLPTNVLPSSAPLIIYSSILQTASMLSKFRDTTEEWTWKPSFTQ